LSPIALPRPIPPADLRKIVLMFGYKQIGETEYNWILSRDGEDEPLVLPRLGTMVSVTVITKMFEHSGMTLGAYLALKYIVDNGSSGVPH
jgi:hypothetical protein